MYNYKWICEILILKEDRLNEVQSLPSHPSDFFYNVQECAEHRKWQAKYKRHPDCNWYENGNSISGD